MPKHHPFSLIVLVAYPKRICLSGRRFKCGGCWLISQFDEDFFEINELAV
jgi:hypothetical protein